jgi:hypothetical protein
MGSIRFMLEHRRVSKMSDLLAEPPTNSLSCHERNRDPDTYH